MSYVVFDENPSIVRYSATEEEKQSMVVQAVIWLGLATDRRSAMKPLAVFTSIIIIVAVAIFFFTTRTSLPKSPYKEGDSALLPPPVQNR